MRALSNLLIWLALVCGTPAAAQGAPAADPGFRSLWTSWDQANRQAMDREIEAQRRVEEDLATADAQRRQLLRNQGRALGERVGEIVRLGDCAEGERLAREAGDFPLVEAVRNHCAIAAGARPE